MAPGLGKTFGGCLLAFNRAATPTRERTYTNLLTQKVHVAYFGLRIVLPM